MKISILAHRGHGYVRPMAEALSRQCLALGHEPRIAWHGLNFLRSGPDPSGIAGRRHALKRCVAPWFFRRLRDADLIVVVCHMPEAYRQILAVEELRRWAPRIPVVLYDLIYLPTLGIWGPWRDPPDEPFRRTAGEYTDMGRYDGYLCISDVNRHGIPPGPQPYARIGLNLQDPALRPEQDAFRALVDFARPDFPEERAVQLCALRETGTEFVELRGDYTLEAIRAVYRRTSLYFVAHMESYGLPVSELQACGAMVFTPRADWCQSHGIKTDLHAEGLGRLTSNFVVYGNDPQRLKEEIVRVRNTYSAERVLDTLRREQPHLIDGDNAALAAFLARIQCGEITSRSHGQYRGLLGQTKQRV